MSLVAVDIWHRPTYSLVVLRKQLTLLFSVRPGAARRRKSGMSLPATDAHYQCPQCGKFEGVESIYVPPVDERTGPPDRRKDSAAAAYLRDRRKSDERRRHNEWKAAHPNSNALNLVCLACDHNWHVAAHD